jgi:hypothetical protein
MYIHPHITDAPNKRTSLEAPPRAEERLVAAVAAVAARQRQPVVELRPSMAKARTISSDL